MTIIGANSGTIITEWTDGEELCTKLFHNSGSIDVGVEILVRIAEDFGFDGYLLNIENKIQSGEKLIEFMGKLHRKLKEASPSNLLIYYDSVLLDGSLKWQNELNDKNL